MKIFCLSVLVIFNCAMAMNGASAITADGKYETLVERGYKWKKNGGSMLICKRDEYLIESRESAFMRDIHKALRNCWSRSAGFVYKCHRCNYSDNTSVIAFYTTHSKQLIWVEADKLKKWTRPIPAATEKMHHDHFERFIEGR